MSALCQDPSGVQLGDDVYDPLSVPDLAVYILHDGSFPLIHGEPAIGSADITEGDLTIAQTFCRIIIHAPADLPGKLLGVILGIALQNRLHQDAGRIVGDILHGAENFDSAVAKGPLMDGAVIPVPGETIQGIDDHIVPVAPLRVPEHLLKARALIVGSGHRPVLVDIQDLDVLAVGKAQAGLDLLVDGYIPLGMAAEAGVNDTFRLVCGVCIRFFFAPHVSLAFPERIC